MKKVELVERETHYGVGCTGMKPADGEPEENLTRLLIDWKSGSDEALQLLTPIVYKELCRLASHYLRD